MDVEGGGASCTTEPAHGASSATDVSLREFLEMRIDYEREINELRHAADDAALRLQAVEYERRLEGLNHENARILEAQDKSVAVEKYDGLVQRFDEFREETKESLLVKEARGEGFSALLGAGNQSLLTLITIVGFALLLLRSF